MSNTSTVEFTEYHKPTLESGEYKITIEQSIASSGKIDQQSYTRDLTIEVQGERFKPLSPEDISAVFPPADSLGLHYMVLPHITVKRSTLPWERFPGQRNDNLPWLVLILFRDTDFEDQSDKPKPKNISLQELRDGQPKVKNPNIVLEPGQTENQQVTVIEVKKKYLQPILPTKSDLAYLAHVRQATGNPPGDECATIICNRLPEPNGMSTVYLVSLEERYDASGNFDFQRAGDEELVRLVSLASWSFACIDPQQSFTEVLQNLNRDPSNPRLPENSNPQAEQNLAMGHVPLPHSLREGSQTVSWYRGPLIPGKNSETTEFPVKGSDELLRYDANLGMFDTSYAAAWQLGRMLTLQNKKLSIDLFNWKRANAQQLKSLEQEIGDLPLLSSPNTETIPIPENIQDWFQRLELLKGIPFNYLLPDERLLPPESIRFFWLDSLWVDCLKDGAFSIGRVSDADYINDGNTRFNSSTDRNATVTGIIIRSQLIPGWPNLLIDGYDQVVPNTDPFEPIQASPLTPIRHEKLAKDVLIYLFEGEVKTIDFHLQPEAMHFGLNVPDKENSHWTKNIRNADGEEITTKVDVTWNNQDKGVVNFQQLAGEFSTYVNCTNSAEFALQMIEGVQKVRFISTAT